MRPIAVDVARGMVYVSVCVCVCVTGTWVCKTTEPIEMSFQGLACVGPKNHILDWAQDWTNPFAFATMRGDNTAV